MRRSKHSPRDVGVEVAYAFLSFPRCDQSHAAYEAAIRLLDARLPQAEAAPYLEVELAHSRRIAKPRVAGQALSTGEAPLEIARIGSAWRISCTGCGEASPLVQFRWQVLDQTVDCRCN